MAGQIIKRGLDTWLVRIFLGKDANGKRNYFNKTIHGTKKDAQKYLTAKLREQDTGVFVEPASLPLNEYLDKWLETAAKQKLRERTFEGYEWMLKKYVRPTIGAKRLCDLKAMDIQTLYNNLKKSGLSARTVRYTHTVLSSSLNQAVKWKLLIQNPCSLCELPRQEKREMQAMSADEASKFLQAAKADKWYVVFLIAIETGMRPEEYLGLKWSDIDFESGIVIVRRGLVWLKGGGWKFEEPKTAKSRRSVPLTQTTLAALKKYKREQAAYMLELGANYQRLDIVFASELGTPYYWKNLYNRHFKKTLEAAEIKTKFRLYDLRHTCATLLLQAGENPKVVSERLGHASVVLTLDTYSHVLPTMQQTATDKLEKMLHVVNE